MTDQPDDEVDWSLATWEGAQRESLRRWAKLPLERVIAALEEMQEIQVALHASNVSTKEIQNTGGVQEPRCDYESAAKADKKK
jgi:hypothetical protein